MPHSNPVVARISPRTYYRWKKLAFTKSLRRSFTKNEQLLIVKDGIRDGICKASRKHKVIAAKVHGWAQQLGLQIPRAAGRFTAQEKLRILEEGYQNGISRVCNAYQIDPTTYYHWKRVLGYSKHLSFTEGERRVIVNEAIRDRIIRASDKHQLYRGTIDRWARRLGLKIPWRRFNTQEKRAILQEAIRNGTGVTCRAYKIAQGPYGIGVGSWDGRVLGPASPYLSFAPQNLLTFHPGVGRVLIN